MLGEGRGAELAVRRRRGGRGAERGEGRGEGEGRRGAQGEGGRGKERKRKSRGKGKGGGRARETQRRRESEAPGSPTIAPGHPINGEQGDRKLLVRNLCVSYKKSFTLKALILKNALRYPKVRRSPPIAPFK